jgi:hypothetical protein
LKTIMGEEEAAATVSSDGGGSAGAPADVVGDPGGIVDVNLWQDKFNERRMQHQRGRKGEKKGPSPVTSSSPVAMAEPRRRLEQVWRFWWARARRCDAKAKAKGRARARART